MNVEMVPHIWSKDSFLAKSQRYASIMMAHDREGWQFGFWSALTFEMLAKAALANVSPTLIADGRSWNNTYFALGYNPSVGKFSPTSVGMKEVLSRLKAILPAFTTEMVDSSTRHMNRRNGELHSGDLPFDKLGTSEWLPEYFTSCEVLLASINETLEQLFGEDEAKSAKTLIESLKDKAAKAVHETIKTHRTEWESKSDEERERMCKQAETLSSRHVGHRVSCPSCSSIALLHGSAVGAPVSSIEDDLIVERQSMLPSHFECTACGLKISGFSKLNACGLGDNFTSTYSYDAAEYFGIETEEDPYAGMEPDFNE